MKKTTLLKKMILDPKILAMPGPHDALSAKIIEQVGFKAIWELYWTNYKTKPKKTKKNNINKKSF